MARNRTSQQLSRTPQKAFRPDCKWPPGSRFLPSQEWRRYLEASGVEAIERLRYDRLRHHLRLQALFGCQIWLGVTGWRRLLHLTCKPALFELGRLCKLWQN